MRVSQRDQADATLFQLKKKKIKAEASMYVT
jgi:hypothetical protein